jgi:hypothetical protein
MQEIKKQPGCWVIVLYVLFCFAGASSGIELGTEAGEFTIDDKPAFLFGISYYGALGASRDFILKDLDDMQRLGFNWIRVWATWSAFDNDISAVDAEGRIRQPYFDKLKWLIAECDRRGMIVDVTLSRGEGVITVGRLGTVKAHQRAVALLASELKGLRNWYLDLANENNIPGRGKKPKTLSFEVLAAMRRAVGDIDPKRLVTVSYVRDAAEADLRHYLIDVGVDFLSPHRIRRPGCAEQTEESTKQCIEIMEKIGRVVPVHYQEPFRRDFSSRHFQPSAGDFTTDLRGAIEGGAAGWCFHNGDNRAASDHNPRRSFDMRNSRLFDQLDSEEHKALKELSRVMRDKSSTVEGFETRRAKLLEMLTSPKMLVGDIDSGGYSYRRAWQYYNACLALGIRLAEANRYFAESDDLAADEWPVLMYIRTYFAFKDTTLSPKARERLEAVMLDYKKNHFRSKNVESLGANGNHSIVNFSMYLLLDQEFGNGAKHEIVRDKFIRWVQYQGKHGRDEVNSPHYLDRSLLPLLNLYDFIEDPKLKLWAQMAIDQIVTDFVVLSLDNVRGGPWCRAHHRHSPGVAQINDGTQDTFWVAGYQFFGNSPMPKYLFNDQILNYGFITTTGYRPPEMVIKIADRKTRGAYEFKSHQKAVDSKPSPGPIDWDMYYYITPLYSLGSLQDRVELDNHVTGSVTKDFKNTQVWELTFSDPMKILGPKRSLAVGTGEKREFVEPENPNTANMQYKNVLFYKGQLMDYNGNLSAGGGDCSGEITGDREFRFWLIPTPEDAVYVGVTHYPSAEAGIVEVATAKEYSDYEAFKRDVRDNPGTCRDTGLYTSYTSCKGDKIVYDHGKATVNAKNWPLHGYKLYECPYVNSVHASGVIAVGNKQIGTLILDFRDPKNPLRTMKTTLE